MSAVPLVFNEALNVSPSFAAIVAAACHGHIFW